MLFRRLFSYLYDLSLKVKSRHQASTTRQSGSCFHCGEAMPAGFELTASFHNKTYPVCCHGCLAILELIESQGAAQTYLARKLALNVKCIDA